MIVLVIVIDMVTGLVMVVYSRCSVAHMLACSLGVMGLSRFLFRPRGVELRI